MTNIYNQYRQETTQDMDAATIAKIRSHKCGRRKLATTSALARMNKLIGDAGQDLKTTITNDPRLVQIVANLNTHLTAYMTAMGLGQGTGAQGNNAIEISELSQGQIPTSLWFGYIGLPTSQEDQATQQTCAAAEEAFADQAGLMRARLALIVTSIGVINDLGNSPEKPNRGGKVGDPAHATHGG